MKIVIQCCPYAAFYVKMEMEKTKNHIQLIPKCQFEMGHFVTNLFMQFQTIFGLFQLDLKYDQLEVVLVDKEWGVLVLVKDLKFLVLFPSHRHMMCSVIG